MVSRFTDGSVDITNIFCGLENGYYFFFVIKNRLLKCANVMKAFFGVAMVNSWLP